MIDEKRLEEIRTQTQKCCCTNVIYDDEMKELIRLARLGLWAEKDGVPILKMYADSVDGMHSAEFEMNGKVSRGPVAPNFYAKLALAALPKEKEK